MDKEFVGRVKMGRFRGKMGGHGTETAKQVWELAEGIVAVLTVSECWYLHYDPDRWQLTEAADLTTKFRTAWLENQNIMTLHPPANGDLPGILDFAKKSLTTLTENANWLPEPREIEDANVMITVECG